jgi:hypothetical protein
MPTVPVIPTFGTYGLDTLAFDPETPLGRIIRTSRMIPLDLANPLVGMAGITTGASRYIAGRHAACSPGSRPAWDGRAVIPATGRPSPTSDLFAMPADGPRLRRACGAFMAVSSRLRKYDPVGPGTGLRPGQPSGIGSVPGGSRLAGRILPCSGKGLLSRVVQVNAPVRVRPGRTRRPSSCCPRR